jgi:lauroyl/myristoyl acyltransferase
LPLPLSRAIGAGIGLVMYAANRKRRRIARVNLRLCFPEKTERERRRLLYRHYIVFGQSVIDLGHLAWSSWARLKRMWRFDGLEHYREQIRQGRSIILLSPHLVGVNFAGPALAQERPTFGMVKPERSEVLNWFLNYARVRRVRGGMFARAQGLRPVIQALRQGYAFYYLPDEDFGPERSVFVPFFNVPTATLPVLGRLAQAADAVVIPCFVRLLSWGRGYEIVLHPPLENYPSGDELEDTARMNRALEAGIRAMPEQYLWTFKFFKTRPDHGPSPYD